MDPVDQFVRRPTMHSHIDEDQPAPGIYDRWGNLLNSNSPALAKRPKAQAVLISKILQAQELAEEYAQTSQNYQTKIGISDAEFRKITQDTIDRLNYDLELLTCEP